MLSSGRSVEPSLMAGRPVHMWSMQQDFLLLCAALSGVGADARTVDGSGRMSGMAVTPYCPG